MSFEHFTTGLWSISDIMVEHENKALQEKALNVVPVTELKIAAMEHLRNMQRAFKEGDIKYEPDIQDILLLELLNWFKHSFFSWYDSPTCRVCGGQTRFDSIRNDINERREINRVEVYLCPPCRQVMYFVRHRNSEKLLETRTGRCGEWVQCFTLICRALGFEVRHVYDVTDHVWAEVFSGSQQRWLHCDPCENVCDNPLMYEVGWKKKLSYIIACSYDDIQDVTWRYTTNFNNTLQRRRLCSEKQLLDFIFKLREHRQRGLSETRRKYLQNQLVKELTVFLTQPKLPDKEFEGRTSGSYQWRISRGETSVKAGFVWTPEPQEVEDQRFRLNYSCEKDSYFRGTDNMSCVSGWQKGVFEYKSIFRKEEKDWKMFYLSRTGGSSKGIIQWKFDFCSSGLVIETVHLKFIRKTFENGTVELSINGNKDTVLVPSGNEVYDTKFFDGSTALIVAAELSGGKGENAWQHAQIFRQPVGADSCAFSIDIKLRKPEK